MVKTHDIKNQTGIFFFFWREAKPLLLPSPHYTKFLSSSHTETHQTHLKIRNLVDKVNMGLHKKRKD